MARGIQYSGERSRWYLMLIEMAQSLGFYFEKRAQQTRKSNGVKYLSRAWKDDSTEGP